MPAVMLSALEVTMLITDLSGTGLLAVCMQITPVADGQVERHAMQ